MRISRIIYNIWHLLKTDLSLVQDEAWEEREVPDQPAMVEQTGRKRKRICLVLDCLLPHDFGTSTSELVNLQHYVIKEKKLSEKEAIVIFYDIVRIVDNLHKVRDSCCPCNMCDLAAFFLQPITDKSDLHGHGLYLRTLQNGHVLQQLLAVALLC